MTDEIRYQGIYIRCQLKVLWKITFHFGRLKTNRGIQCIGIKSRLLRGSLEGRKQIRFTMQRGCLSARDYFKTEFPPLCKCQTFITHNLFISLHIKLVMLHSFSFLSVLWERSGMQADCDVNDSDEWRLETLFHPFLQLRLPAVAALEVSPLLVHMWYCYRLKKSLKDERTNAWMNEWTDGWLYVWTNKRKEGKETKI